MNIQHTANQAEFAATVLQNDKYVLVDFWAEWCGPCRAMAEVLQQLAQLPEFEGKLEIVKIDVDESDENAMIANNYQVRGIPNMKLFHQGKVVGEIMGYIVLPELLEKLRGMIA